MYVKRLPRVCQRQQLLTLMQFKRPLGPLFSSPTYLVFQSLGFLSISFLVCWPQGQGLAPSIYGLFRAS